MNEAKLIFISFPKATLDKSPKEKIGIRLSDIRHYESTLYNNRPIVLVVFKLDSQDNGQVLIDLPIDEFEGRLKDAITRCLMLKERSR